MGIITNLIPVFLLFALSYVFLRRIQTIRSEKDTEVLVRRIGNTLKSILINNELSIQGDASTTDTSKNAEKEMISRLSSLRSESADLRAVVAFLEQTSVERGLQSIHDTVEEISNVFLIRDKAVLNRSNKSFLETQLNKQEIIKGSSSGYLGCTKMTTSVLKIAIPKVVSDANTSNLAYYVLVREDYERDYKPSHSAYINYHFVKVDNGLKISRLESLRY